MASEFAYTVDKDGVKNESSFIFRIIKCKFILKGVFKWKKYQL